MREKRKAAEYSIEKEKSKKNPHVDSYKCLLPWEFFFFRHCCLRGSIFHPGLFLSEREKKKDVGFSRGLIPLIFYTRARKIVFWANIWRKTPEGRGHKFCWSAKSTLNICLPLSIAKWTLSEKVIKSPSTRKASIHFLFCDVFSFFRGHIFLSLFLCSLFGALDWLTRGFVSQTRRGSGNKGAFFPWHLWGKSGKMTWKKWLFETTYTR